LVVQSTARLAAAAAEANLTNIIFIETEELLRLQLAPVLIASVATTLRYVEFGF
jgi:hypothetical protein